jgi:hypothetical protein
MFRRSLAWRKRTPRRCAGDRSADAASTSLSTLPSTGFTISKLPFVVGGNVQSGVRWPSLAVRKQREQPSSHKYRSIGEVTFRCKHCALDLFIFNLTLSKREGFGSSTSITNTVIDFCLCCQVRRTIYQQNCSYRDHNMERKVAVRQKYWCVTNRCFSQGHIVYIGYQSPHAKSASVMFESVSA